MPPTMKKALSAAGFIFLLTIGLSVYTGNLQRKQANATEQMAKDIHHMMLKLDSIAK